MANETVILTKYQAERLINGLAMEIWNETVDIPIDISARLTSRFGYFRTVVRNRKRVALNIAFAQRMFMGDYKLCTIIDVIKHELAHYLLFKKGIAGFHDGDMEFENELKRVGAYSTRTLTSPGLKHVATCSRCGTVVMEGTEKRVKNSCNTTRWVSRCCRAKLSYYGTRYITDATIPRQALNPRFNMENLQTIKDVINEKSNPIINKPTEIKHITETQEIAASSPSVINTIKIDDVLSGITGKITGNKIFKTVVKLLNEQEKDKLILINNNYPQAMKICINEKYLGKKRYAYAKQIGL